MKILIKKKFISTFIITLVTSIILTCSIAFANGGSFSYTVYASSRGGLVDGSQNGVYYTLTKGYTGRVHLEMSDYTNPGTTYIKLYREIAGWPDPSFGSKKLGTDSLVWFVDQDSNKYYFVVVCYGTSSYSSLFTGSGTLYDY